MTARYIDIRQTIGETENSPSLSIDSEGTVTLGSGSISSSALTDSDFTARRVSSDINFNEISTTPTTTHIGTGQINIDPAPQPVFNFTAFHNNDSSRKKDNLDKGSLTFIEMKMEKKDDYMLVHMTYIDKETYEEVVKSFNCDLSASENYRYNFYSNESTVGNINLELKNIGAIQETRKQL